MARPSARIGDGPPDPERPDLTDSELAADGFPAGAISTKVVDGTGER